MRRVLRRHLDFAPVDGFALRGDRQRRAALYGLAVAQPAREFIPGGGHGRKRHLAALSIDARTFNAAELWLRRGGLHDDDLRHIGPEPGGHGVEIVDAIIEKRPSGNEFAMVHPAKEFSAVTGYCLYFGLRAQIVVARALGFPPLTAVHAFRDDIEPAALDENAHGPIFASHCRAFDFIGKVGLVANRVDPVFGVQLRVVIMANHRVAFADIRRERAAAVYAVGLYRKRNALRRRAVNAVHARLGLNRRLIEKHRDEHRVAFDLKLVSGIFRNDFAFLIFPIREYPARRRAASLNLARIALLKAPRTFDDVVWPGPLTRNADREALIPLFAQGARRIGVGRHRSVIVAHMDIRAVHIRLEQLAIRGRRGEELAERVVLQIGIFVFLLSASIIERNAHAAQRNGIARLICHGRWVGLHLDG